MCIAESFKHSFEPLQVAHQHTFKMWGGLLKQPPKAGKAVVSQKKKVGKVSERKHLCTFEKWLIFFSPVLSFPYLLTHGQMDRPKLLALSSLA